MPHPTAARAAVAGGHGGGWTRGREAHSRLSTTRAPPMPNKQDQPEKYWDRLFAPSSCLSIITSVDHDGRVNAAAFGTCTRVLHNPVYLAFTTTLGNDTANNILATGAFV